MTRRAADAAGRVLACRIAEAMIDLDRVRLAKAPLMGALDAEPCDTRALMQLSRLDRYERRAFARCKRAIREFVAVMLSEELTKRSQRGNANEFKAGVPARTCPRTSFGRTNPFRDLCTAVAFGRTKPIARRRSPPDTVLTKRSQLE